jgi:hypothetical protein
MKAAYVAGIAFAGILGSEITLAGPGPSTKTGGGGAGPSAPSAPAGAVPAPAPAPHVSSHPPASIAAPPSQPPSSIAVPHAPATAVQQPPKPAPPPHAPAQSAPIKATAPASQPSHAGGNAMPQQSSVPAETYHPPTTVKEAVERAGEVEKAPPPPKPRASEMLKDSPKPADLVTKENVQPRTGPTIENYRAPIVPPARQGLDPSDNPATELPVPGERGYPASPNMAPPGTPGSNVEPGPGLLR